MSILNVNTIQPVGSRQTITVSAANITASSTTITANSINVGNTFIRNTSIGIGTITTTARNAGINTAEGTIIYNSTEKSVQVYDGAAWVDIRDTGTGIKATGGTITQVLVLVQ